MTAVLFLQTLASKSDRQVASVCSAASAAVINAALLPVAPCDHTHSQVAAMVSELKTCTYLLCQSVRIAKLVDRLRLIETFCSCLM